MSIVLREGLGRPLTHDEVDGNFEYLDENKISSRVAVARALNVPEEDVLEAADGAAIPANITHLYVSEQETTYAKPADVPDGAIIASIVDNGLLVQGGQTYMLPKAQPALYQYDSIDFDEVYGGSADKHLALVAALSTSKIVYLRSSISVGDLVLNPRNKLISRSDDVVLTANSIDMDANFCELKGLTLDASGTTATTAFVRGTGSTEPKIRYCKFQNVPDTLENVRWTDAVKGRIHECDTTDGQRAFTLWRGCVKCKITGGSIANCKGINILIHTSQTATGGTYETYGHRVNGIDITNSGRGDSVTNPEAHAIQVWGMDSAELNQSQDAYDIKISDVNIDQCTGAGIWTACAKGVSVGGCIIKNVRKEGIDFEGSLDCTSTNNKLYNAGRTFGSLTILFRSERCFHSGNEVVFDGDFALLGGGEHPLTSSLAGYMRDANLDCGITGNEVSAINSNGKLSAITVFKSTVDVNSSTGSVKARLEGNYGRNFAIRVLADCPYPKIKRNEISYDDGVFASGSLAKVLYVVNSIAPEIDGNNIEIDGEVRDTNTSSNNAVIFCLYDANPQRGVRAQINRNTVRNFDSGITFQNFYSGRDSDGSLQCIGNTTAKISYSSTISDTAFADNYSDSDFSVVAPTPV